MGNIFRIIKYNISDCILFKSFITTPIIIKKKIMDIIIIKPIIQNTDIENTDIENTDIENPIIKKHVVENTVVVKPVIENTIVDNTVVENPVIENTIVNKIIIDEEIIIMKKRKSKSELFFDKKFYSVLQERGNDVFTVHKINENVVLVKFTADYNNFCVIYKMYNNKNMVNYYTYAKFKLIRKYNTLYREHVYNSISIGDLLDDVKTIYEYIEYYKKYDK